jgi:hypothetical protein
MRSGARQCQWILASGKTFHGHCRRYATSRHDAKLLALSPLRNSCFASGEAMDCSLQLLPAPHWRCKQDRNPALVRVFPERTHGVRARASNFSTRGWIGCRDEVGDQLRVYYVPGRWRSVNAFRSREAQSAREDHVVGKLHVARCAQVVVPDGAPDSSKPSEPLTRWCIV